VRAFLYGLGAAVLALAGFEIVMQPTANDRLQLGLLFVTMAAVAALTAWAIPRWAARARSIRLVVVVLVLVGFGIVAAVLVAAADRMFLSGHDLQLMLIVVGFGAMAALGFGLAISAPLTADLRRMVDMTARVTAGDLGARTAVRRNDEIGALAAALDEMAAALEAAETARRREEKGRQEFFMAVGHDLRSPLATIQAAVEALEDGIARDPERYLASIAGEVDTLQALVDDLYLLARIDADAIPEEAVAIDVAELADDAIEALRPKADRANVRIRLDADGAVAARARPDAVGRVVRNLLDNAVRHAPEGSEIVVRVEARAGGGAAVAVLDEGPGFDESFIAVAFDPFSRPDPSRRRDTGGTGLGLAIADGFVRRFGGEMWIEPGPGGRIGFVLPAVSA